MASFSQTIKQFTVDVTEDTAIVLRSAAVKLYKEVIKPKSESGNLPHDTGNLGRSFEASLTAMPIVDPVTRDYAQGSTGATIMTYNLSDTLWMGFQASYAPRMNYGFVGTDSRGRTFNETGNYFVEKAEAKWPEFVAQSIRELNGK